MSDLDSQEDSASWEQESQSNVAPRFSEASSESEQSEEEVTSWKKKRKGKKKGKRPTMVEAMLP